MKVKVKKPTLDEILAAARGEFEIDVTAEMLMAGGIDQQAVLAGIMTKAGMVAGDSNADAKLDKLQVSIDALPAALATALKAVMTEAKPEITSTATIQMPAELTAALTAIKADVATTVTTVNALQGQVTTLAEQSAQAARTAAAVQEEFAKRPEAGLFGKVTPQMVAALEMSQKAANQVFAFDTVNLTEE